MFRVLPTTQRENIVYIQGAKSDDKDRPVATLMLQNYDADTRKIYNMAAMSVYDHFGNADSNGIGDLVFKTNTTGTSNPLTPQMRLLYNGNLLLGDPPTTSNRLNVQGNVYVSSNLETYAANISKLNVTELFIQDIPFVPDAISSNITKSNIESITGYISTLSVDEFSLCNVPLDTIIRQTVQLDSSNILSSDVLPDIPAPKIIGTFCNLEANTIVNPQGVITSGIVLQRFDVSVLPLPTASNNTDPITYYKDWGPWSLASPTSNLSAFQVLYARYTQLNTTATIAFSVEFTCTSNIDQVEGNLPAPSKHALAMPVFLSTPVQDPSPNRLGKLVLSQGQQVFQVVYATFTSGTWCFSGCYTYETT